MLKQLIQKLVNVLGARKFRIGVRVARLALDQQVEVRTFDPEPNKRKKAMSSSYPSIYGFGKSEVLGILLGPVVVQEKVDGSQFSFGVKDGQLVTRSKGQTFPPAQAPGLFKLATATAISLHAAGDLIEGWMYRGEVLAKPKHNVLAYSRVPIGNVILFDVESAPGAYLKPDELSKIALDLGLESVPLLMNGSCTFEEIQKLLELESCLGGPKIEGVVIKSPQVDRHGNRLMAKYVSPAFKEVHDKNFQPRERVDPAVVLRDKYKSEARYRKAVQHLRELDVLEGTERDIGKIVTELKADFLRECEEQVKQDLWEMFWPGLAKAVVADVALTYKADLLEIALEKMK